ncbi:hypothetical protein [Halorussus pelagicus]|nr:hypothetical protein [Halorussus pelagicus]
MGERPGRVDSPPLVVPGRVVAVVDALSGADDSASRADRIDS